MEEECVPCLQVRWRKVNWSHYPERGSGPHGLAIGGGEADEEQRAGVADVAGIMDDASGNRDGVAGGHLCFVVTHRVEDFAVEDVEHFLAVWVKMARVHPAGRERGAAHGHGFGIAELPRGEPRKRAGWHRDTGGVGGAEDDG